MSSVAAREVRLNVYDLHQSNSWLQHIGLGVYHSGLEVMGVEYTFSEAGISQHPPRLVNAEGCVYKTTEVLGDFVGTIQDVRVNLNRLRQGDFAEGTYHVVRKNCNHFCDEFSFALIGKRIPGWVNRAASLGRWAGVGGANTTAPAGTPGRTVSASSSASVSGSGGAAAATVRASCAPSKGPRELTQRQRDLLAKMRSKKSSG